MKLAKVFLTLFFTGFLATSALAQENISLVIGKNLKVGMPLHEAISLLGIPNDFEIQRGTEPVNDIVAIDYPNHGVILYILNKKNIVEGIEVLPGFKGKFAEGFKIGAKFNDLIAKYGVPSSLKANVARYPEKGMFFIMKKETLVSAKLFSRNSKMLDHQMLAK